MLTQFRSLDSIEKKTSLEPSNLRESFSFRFNSKQDSQSFASINCITLCAVAIIKSVIDNFIHVKVNELSR